MLPTVLALLGMLLQPACLIYARMMMDQAAAETARLLVTASNEEDTVRSFCLRRLESVPHAALFHTSGDEGWSVEFSEHAGDVEVSIVGHARPLPVFGMLTRLMLEHDEEGVILRSKYRISLRPSWLEGGQEDWAGVWND